MKKIFTITLIIFCMILVIRYIPYNYQSIRPLKIKVIDSVSKEPLKDIKVNYTLHVYYGKTIFFIIPDIFSCNAPFEHLRKEYITDANGEIFVKEYSIFIKLFDSISYEHVYVNFNNKSKEFYDAFYDDKKILCILINPHYKGFYIAAFNYDIVPKNWGNSHNKDFTRWQSFNANFIGNSFIKEKEDIIVELEKIK